MIKIKLKFNECMDEWNRRGGDGFCNGTLSEFWDLPQEDGAVIILEILEAKAKGTTRMMMGGDKAVFVDETHGSEYILSEMRSKMERAGVKQGQIYHVRFMI